MRNTLLMLVMMSCMGGVQIGSAQTQMGSEDPLQSPPSVGDSALATSTVTSSDVSHATTIEVAPNVSADAAAANPIVKENTAKDTKATKEDHTASMRPDDPQKNPYWEPRDWTYINNSAP